MQRPRAREVEDRAPRDAGMILASTMVLTVALAVVVVAVLGYVVVGLKTSRVTTERTEDAAAAAAAVYWVIEDLASGGTCADTDTPAAAMPHRESVTVSCLLVVSTDGLDRVQLVAAASNSSAGRVTALVEYRPAETAPRAIRIYDWDAGLAVTSS